jgi:NAD(P)-dependent dehydrogenase (short-subunit alcohol dehydrogenase family)
LKVYGLTTGTPRTGLGLEAAKHFYRLDCARLILAVRSVSKGEAAQREIEETTTRSPSGEGVIQVWPVDMDSFPSVQAFAERVNTELDRVDVVLLNAGVYGKEFRQSPEGWEGHLQVNVLSTALLACLLLPKLKASRRGEEIPHLGIGTYPTNPFPQ